MSEKKETKEQREKRLLRKKAYYQSHKEQWQNYEKQHRIELNAKIRERRKKPQHKAIRLKIERKWKANNIETMKQARKNWTNKHPEKPKEYSHNFDVRYPELKPVHNHARYLELGTQCEICGSAEHLEKHHPDYSEPEVIITLCKECHTEVTLDNKGGRVIPFV